MRVLPHSPTVIEVCYIARHEFCRVVHSQIYTQDTILTESRSRGVNMPRRYVLKYHCVANLRVGSGHEVLRYSKYKHLGHI